jgi:hypothetical protein
MKSYKYILISVLLCGCSTTKINFAKQNQWTFNRSKCEVTDSANRMTFTFKLKEQERIANLSNCSDSLNFVTSEKDFNQGYKCTDYIRSVLRDVPINTDSICYILADHIVVFKCNSKNDIWKPDYILTRDGNFFCTSGDNTKGKIQDEGNELWRNLIVQRKDRRIICVDRFYLRNKCIGIIYIIQADHKKWPYCGTCHWNVTDPHCLEMAGNILDYDKQISRNIWDKNK